MLALIPTGMGPGAHPLHHKPSSTSSHRQPEWAAAATAAHPAAHSRRERTHAAHPPPHTHTSHRQPGSATIRLPADSPLLLREAGSALRCSSSSTVCRWLPWVAISRAVAPCTHGRAAWAGAVSGVVAQPCLDAPRFHGPHSRCCTASHQEGSPPTYRPPQHRRPERWMPQRMSSTPTTEQAGAMTQGSSTHPLPLPHPHPPPSESCC